MVSTPIVLAMPEPMARALGWPDSAIGWSDLLNLADHPDGWGAKGHPEWGAFKLGKTNPNISTTGLSATVGVFVAATGTSSDLTLDTLKDPRVREFVAGVEKSVAHYGDTALTFLTNLQRADDAGAALGYVARWPSRRSPSWTTTTGNPTGDPQNEGQHGQAPGAAGRHLPEGGDAQQRQPLCGSSGALVRTRASRPAPRTFGFLREPAQQELFTDAGFRTYDGRPGKAVSDSEYLRADIGVPHSPRPARRSWRRCAPLGRNCASRHTYCWCWTCPGRWDSRPAGVRPGWNSPRTRR